MYKAGTVAEWRNLGLRGKIPDEVYQEATGIELMKVSSRPGSWALRPPKTGPGHA